MAINLEEEQNQSVQGIANEVASRPTAALIPGSTPASGVPAQRMDQVNQPLDPQVAADRQAVRGAWNTVKGANARAGAAIADLATLPVRGVAGAYDSAVVRPMRAAGLNAAYLSPNLVPNGANVNSMTPFYDQFRERDQVQQGIADRAGQANAFNDPRSLTNPSRPVSQLAQLAQPQQPAPVAPRTQSVQRPGVLGSAARKANPQPVAEAQPNPNDPNPMQGVAYTALGGIMGPDGDGSSKAAVAMQDGSRVYGADALKTINATDAYLQRNPVAQTPVEVMRWAGDVYDNGIAGAWQLGNGKVSRTTAGPAAGYGNEVESGAFNALNQTPGGMKGYIANLAQGAQDAANPSAARERLARIQDEAARMNAGTRAQELAFQRELNDQDKYVPGGRVTTESLDGTKQTTYAPDRFVNAKNKKITVIDPDRGEEQKPSLQSMIGKAYSGGDGVHPVKGTNQKVVVKNGRVVEVK